MTAEEAEAVHTAAVAFGATHLYSWRLMATSRQEVQTGVTEAADLSDLRRIVIEDFLGDAGRSRLDIEGDEFLYIDAVDDDHVDQEIDLREHGEPFSWMARELVKELAKAPANLNPHLDEWIAKAQRLLENDDAGKAGGEPAQGHAEGQTAASV